MEEPKPQGKGKVLKAGKPADAEAKSEDAAANIALAKQPVLKAEKAKAAAQKAEAATAEPAKVEKTRPLGKIDASGQVEKEQPVQLVAADWKAGVELARKSSKKRKFEQTWDLAINVKGLDLKKPENRINADILLPAGRGREQKVAVIADSLATEAKESADFVMDKNQLVAIANRKKEIKALADGYDWFLGEVTLMASIGKILGAHFGPRGKMPRPLPPKVKVEPFVQKLKKSAKVQLKENPVIHVAIGAEQMKDEDIARNAEAVFTLVKEKLPKGINSIRSAYIKLTMGKPVKVEAK